MNARSTCASALAIALAACTTAPSTPDTPADAFFQRLSTLCGQAFAGRVEVDAPAPTGADPFAAGPLVMHVRECTPDAIRIPFHVGADRSRTWVVTRRPGGLRLQHDHRHEDGSPDALTLYGGDTRDAGTPTRQEFPADGASRAMFLAQGRAVSVDNTWAMEIEPGRAFVYELARPGRLFRVEFDLASPVPPPPAPWGAGG